MSGMDLSNIFKQVEDMRAVGEIGKNDKVYLPGETYNHQTLKGSKIMLCPFCKVYLPAMYLALDDKIGEQTQGYSCSACDKPIVAITRRRSDGVIINKYAAPGYAFTR